MDYRGKIGFKMDSQKVRFLNIEIDNMTMDEVVGTIRSYIIERKTRYIVTPNVDHMIQLQENNKLQEAYKNADLVVCDGMPLVWISKYFGSPIKERINGTNLFYRLCEEARQNNYRIYIMGGNEGVAVKAGKELEKRYKGAKVVGTDSPPFGFEKNERYISELIDKINHSNADILAVCLGCPKQEYFMCNYKHKINVPVMMGIGSAIDFLSGYKKRAPKWVQNMGFEWLYRFFQEPTRLFRRYFVDDIKIFKLAVKYKYKPELFAKQTKK